MKITKYETKEEWMDGRERRITGTTLIDVTPKATKSKEPYAEKREGWFTLIAENLSIRSDSENEYEKPMDRGNRLEPEAIDKFTEKTGIEICKDRVILSRDDNENIANSPDGYSLDFKVEVETKCLGRGKHAEALLTNKIPKAFYYQNLQPFIVNEKLEILYFVMYDPRFIVNQLIIFEIKREELKDEIAEYLEVQRKALEEISEIIKKIMGEEDGK